MAWEKRGLLIEPPTHLPWVASHAAVPFVDPAPPQPLAYFTARNERGQSQIARATLQVDGADISAEVDPEPVLRPGRLGTFDDSGVMTSSLVRDGDRQLLYYQGWSQGVTVPFYVFAGCAASEDGGRSFARVSEAPVLGRSATDPVLVASPWVMTDPDGWRMWYVSAKGWSSGTDGEQHYYVHIKHARSDDGIEWRPDGGVAVDCEGEDEYAVGRPTVIRDGDLFRMWYAHRGASYRIGYADSPDGLEWTRRDDAPEAAIEPSTSGWDADMVEYGAVFDHGGHRFMLYNGNGFGETGTGYAVWRD